MDPHRVCEAASKPPLKPRSFAFAKVSERNYIGCLKDAREVVAVD
jgi:hypothetical protein